jgi:hypothetical protein
LAKTSVSRIALVHITNAWLGSLGLNVTDVIESQKSRVATERCQLKRAKMAIVMVKRE